MPNLRADGKMTAHVATKRKLKKVSLVADFEDILSRCMIHDEDKQILRMYYINGKDFNFIADTMGYTERAVRDRHKHALEKIADAL